MSDNGSFVVIWTSDYQDGDSYGVFAQRFSSAGLPAGTDFQVNTYTIGTQRYDAKVAMDGVGDFVVVWRGPFYDGNRILARLYSSSGAPMGSELQVNSYTSFGVYGSTVVMDDDGDFVVAWSQRTSGDAEDTVISARRYSSAGMPLSDQFVVNSYTPGFQGWVNVAMNSAGDWTATWASAPNSGSFYSLHAQRFASSGSRLGGELELSTYDIANPVSALADDGDFVVVWLRDLDVFARRFASSGAALGTEFRVNTYTTTFQYRADVATNAAGHFVVTWGEIGGGPDRILAQSFSRLGARVGGEFQVNTNTHFNQRDPAIAMERSGDFIVAWFSPYLGTYAGIFARRFGAPPLDIDGDATIGVFTDGLLVLRWAFGFRGTTLVSGVVGEDCFRCDSPQVEEHLSEIDGLLDVDGNGVVGALTDGLLVVRHLFGFSGSALVTGTVDLATCTRCTAAEIVNHLESLGG